MTLHAFDLVTGESISWVAVPLEFVDWMALNFTGAFIQHLRNIDPYDSVLVPSAVLAEAAREMTRVKDTLQSNPNMAVPETVDLFGHYGNEGGLKTAKELIKFLEITLSKECKVVSVGD